MITTPPFPFTSTSALWITLAVKKLSVTGPSPGPSARALRATKPVLLTAEPVGVNDIFAGHGFTSPDVQASRSRTEVRRTRPHHDRRCAVQVLYRIYPVAGWRNTTSPPIASQSGCLCSAFCDYTKCCHCGASAVVCAVRI